MGVDGMSNDKEQRIRMRAYAIWERGGHGEGRAEDHWREAEIEVERELAQPAAQVDKPQKQAKKKASGNGKLSPAKSHADTSKTEKTKKPATSRSKKASTDAKPSGAAAPSGSAEKTARTRSRQTTPT